MIARRRAVVPLALALFALTGCGADIGPDAGGEPSPTPSASTEASASATPSPRPTPEPSASTGTTVAVPTDCRDIVSVEAYDAVFGSTPLNPAGFTTRSGGPFGRITPTQPPADATPEEAVASATSLDCLWRDPNADITSIEVAMAAVDPEVGAAFLDDRANEGFTCVNVYDGRRCQLVRPNEQVPEADEAHTRFVRDGIVVSVDQVNFSTDDLLGDIVDRVWG
jgi:hypothetical protein